MQDPEIYNDEEEGQNNPDSKNEPHCNIVLAKCFGELLSILLYSIMIVLLIVGLLHQIVIGKPLTGLIEFAIAIVID